MSPEQQPGESFQPPPSPWQAQAPAVPPAPDIGAATPGALPPWYEDPLTAETLRILDQPRPERSWVQNAVLLGVTLLLFAGAGVFSTSPIDLAILVAVLLFHEGGHYLGMRLFNYQDVRMFFIPLFGAAVSGRATSVAGYKEAIVLLLGPLPGLMLGAVLGVACLSYDSEPLRTAAMMLLAINGFNLLPLMPLDGGRLVHLVIFSRQRHLEAGFRVLAAVLLGLAAWGMGAWLLGLLAVWMLFSVQANFYISKLAQQLRGEARDLPEVNPAGNIPLEWAVRIIDAVRAQMPVLKQPTTLAGMVRQIWERMHLRPPGLVASLALLGIYGLALVGTPVIVVWLTMPRPMVVTATRHDGTTGEIEETRSWGRLVETTELNASGQPDGRYVKYGFRDGGVLEEGSYADGLQEGVWTWYTEDGQVESQQEFRDGEPMSKGERGASVPR